MKKILLALVLLMLPTLALAQSSQRNPCYSTGTTGNCISVGTNRPLPVIGNSNISTYSAAITAQAYTVAGDVYCKS
jgi:hypothetical protein